MSDLRKGDIVMVVTPSNGLHPLDLTAGVVGKVGTVVGGPMRDIDIIRGTVDAYKVDLPHDDHLWLIGRPALRKITGPGVLDEHETRDEILASQLDRASPPVPVSQSHN